MALNLEKQLLFYGSYHHDPINIIIHTIFVPILLLTAFLFGTNTGDLFTLPPWLTLPSLPPNLGTIACFTYTSLYILMEPVAGALLAPFLISGAALGNQLTSTYGMKANYVAIGVHIVSWLVQFVGHGVYEGRAPALLDNLVQALFLAPFFVWLEVLFSLGYRPELKARLDKAIEQEITKHKTTQEKKQLNGAAKPNGSTNGDVK